MPWIRVDSLALEAADGTRGVVAGSSAALMPADNAWVRDVDRCLSDSKRTYVSEELPKRWIHIYNRQLSQSEQRKIVDMISVDTSPLASRHFLWPQDTVLDEDYEIIGYITWSANGMMPLGCLLAAYAKPSYGQKITIAKNLCVALGMFHNAGFVLGDFTIGRIMVDPQTFRVLLDPFLDVQFECPVHGFYPCQTGVSEYLAPEVQQARGNFTANSDLFALGIIIFALLHGNRHPFSALRARIPLLIRLPVRGGRITFSANVLPYDMPATFSNFITFKAANYQLPRYRNHGQGEVFDRCFSAAAPSLRPSAEEWFSLLDALSRSARGSLSRWFDKSEGVKRTSETMRADANNEVRRAIAEQYPSDVSGSEPLSSPRVFWRTTMLFAAGVALCSLASSERLGVVIARVTQAAPSSWGNVSAALFSSMHPAGLVLGAFVGMLLGNWIASASRGIRGYRFRWYVLSFVCSVVFCVLFGMFFGGVR